MSKAKLTHIVYTLHDDVQNEKHESLNTELVEMLNNFIHPQTLRVPQDDAEGVFRCF
jgi:hypothetical protein